MHSAGFHPWAAVNRLLAGKPSPPCEGSDGFHVYSLTGIWLVEVERQWRLMGKNILLLHSPCFCFVDLLIVFLVQGQRQVSRFWSSPGIAVCVCVCDAAWVDGLCRAPLWGSQCDPAVFSLPVLHVTHHSHLVRSCFNKALLFLQHGLTSWGLIDWPGRVAKVLPITLYDLETSIFLVSTRITCWLSFCFNNYFVKLWICE